jgi:hypothetical protein
MGAATLLQDPLESWDLSAGATPEVKGFFGDNYLGLSERR